MVALVLSDGVVLSQDVGRFGALDDLTDEFFDDIGRRCRQLSYGGLDSQCQADRVIAGFLALCVLQALFRSQSELVRMLVIHRPSLFRYECSDISRCLRDLLYLLWLCGCSRARRRRLTTCWTVCIVFVLFAFVCSCVCVCVFVCVRVFVFVCVLCVCVCVLGVCVCVGVCVVCVCVGVGLCLCGACVFCRARYWFAAGSLGCFLAAGPSLRATVAWDVFLASSDSPLGPICVVLAWTFRARVCPRWLAGGVCNRGALGRSVRVIGCCFVVGFRFDM